MAEAEDIRDGSGSDKDAQTEYKWFESNVRAQVVVDEVARQEAKKLDQKTQVGGGGCIGIDCIIFRGLNSDAKVITISTGRPRCC